MQTSPLRKVDTPALFLDLDIIERNLDAMQQKMTGLGVDLRPHIKTHKIPELALWQIEKGAKGITCAKLSEARVMAGAGVKDIFIANQITTPCKISGIWDLAREVCLSVGLDSVAGAKMLSELFAAKGGELEYLIELDTGLKRCGVLPGEPAWKLHQQIKDLPGLKFKGLFTHAGHVYGSANREEVEAISRYESRLTQETAEIFRQNQVEPQVVSVGSTPTMKVWQGHQGITEARPGCYLLNDAMQVGMGVAELEDCALSLGATVISRPTPDRAVIDAGAKALALDKGGHGLETVKGHGVIPGRDAYPERLSEEHGILKVAPDEPLSVGDMVRIIPNHACPVMNLFDRAYGIRNGRVEKEFEIAARGKSQ
ncbi:alanine racemase [Dethiosulfatarculus sandiegensis]|uniref:D-serine dehydratase-like domain-containing protein n=1 Tax=Dethiosulfatarculus sandiegensis TaxID=1429043 RepID=A0A0D2J9A4_9BACT|nr:alanine racemase [Dethiosulfatarculus sandiegensis]KIX14734.1 hypothetical protein X474_06225 [Dethiosulfatarculus sandiegensis]